MDFIELTATGIDLETYVNTDIGGIPTRKSVTMSISSRMHIIQRRRTDWPLSYGTGTSATVHMWRSRTQSRAPRLHTPRCQQWGSWWSYWASDGSTLRQHMSPSLHGRTCCMAVGTVVTRCYARVRNTADVGEAALQTPLSMKIYVVQNTIHTGFLSLSLIPLPYIINSNIQWQQQRQVHLQQINTFNLQQPHIFVITTPFNEPARLVRLYAVCW